MSARPVTESANRCADMALRRAVACGVPTRLDAERMRPDIREREPESGRPERPGACRVGACLRITGGILRVRQAPAPPLLPSPRSRLQAELLTLVLLSPGREWSLTELADRTGCSLSSAQREMARAEEAGVASSRRLGSTRLVSAADSPLTGPLTELLVRSFGPRQAVAEEPAPVQRIEAAYLFGSWAARYEGEPGRAPADIDVLVIGDPTATSLTRPPSGPAGGWPGKSVSQCGRRSGGGKASTVSTPK